MNRRPPQNVPAEIRNVIARLRSRIRAYVWLEGIAAAVIWFGLTFWAGLALDYLPVLVGSSEMPRAARLTLLVIVSTVLLYIVYRWILRRAFARIADKSLALLIERKFPEFQHSLVTTVEYGTKAADDPATDAHLLTRTREAATGRVADIQLSQVFNFGPLVRNSLGAVVLILSVLAFAAFANDAFATWTSRFYMLSDDPWPRRAHIEVLDFNEKDLMKVAEGGDVTIRVRAAADREIPPPDVCTIHYRMDNGERGRANMSKDGEPRDSYQYYSFNSTPFKGMLDGVDFDVVGFDHRVSGFRIEVVASPAVVGVKLRSELPAYTGLLPRKDDWTVATRLPVGSKITVTASANKPLDRIEFTSCSLSRSSRLLPMHLIATAKNSGVRSRPVIAGINTHCAHILFTPQSRFTRCPGFLRSTFTRSAPITFRLLTSASYRLHTDRDTMGRELEREGQSCSIILFMRAIGRHGLQIEPPDSRHPECLRLHFS